MVIAILEHNTDGINKISTSTQAVCLYRKKNFFFVKKTFLEQKALKYSNGLDRTNCFYTKKKEEKQKAFVMYN